eukprot:scaffold13887_cov120-Skeletonema_dohrnii-CCMP3373.AAC.4
MKGILLAPDVDVSQLSASLSGDTLTVHAPKVEKALEEEKLEQIETGRDNTYQCNKIVVDLKTCQCPQIGLPSPSQIPAMIANFQRS